jgi:hypothetical protein
MTKFREKWIRFGCGLIGYNSSMLMACSELSKKRALRYISALLILVPLWASIGFSFCQRYLNDSLISCSIAAILMVFLIIQIERQVILSENSKSYLRIFRGVIAIIMALIGSVIIDQIIFKEDIEQKKIFLIGEKVDAIVPSRSKEIRELIAAMDSAIQTKEIERKAISDDISKHPLVVTYEHHVQKDTSGNKLTTTIRKQVDNPKSVLLQPLDNVITGMRRDKLRNDSLLVSLRPVIESELKASKGFLDELNTMFAIISNSKIAFCAWLIWFLFLLGLELFILVSRLGERENDYDLIMKQQMDLHIRRVELLRLQNIK